MIIRILKRGKGVKFFDIVVMYKGRVVCYIGKVEYFEHINITLNFKEFMLYSYSGFKMIGCFFKLLKFIVNIEELYLFCKK